MLGDSESHGDMSCLWEFGISRTKCNVVLEEKRVEMRNKKVKVLHFELSDSVGGIETFLYNVLSNIDHTQYDFDFVTVKDNPGLGEKIQNLGGGIHHIAPYKRIIKYIKDLSRIMDDVEIVHIHKNSAANILPAIVAKKKKKKVIVHAHNTSTSENKIFNLLHYVNRPVLRWLADEKLACSQLAGEWLFGKKENVTIINNGIHLDKFCYSKEKRENKREELNLSSSLIVGHVGRFNFQKNHTFLIDIFFELQKISPDAKLVLAGQGELLSEICEKVQYLGIERKVLFLGECSDIEDLLQCFDIFIMPSLFEGLPIAGIEAQAAGLPLLVSDTISGELELTPYVKKLSLDEPPEVWAERALDLLDGYERTARQIGLLKKYSIENTVSQLERIYLV